MVKKRPCLPEPTHETLLRPPPLPLQLQLPARRLPRRASGGTRGRAGLQRHRHHRRMLSLRRGARACGSQRPQDQTDHRRGIRGARCARHRPADPARQKPQRLRRPQRTHHAGAFTLAQRRIPVVHRRPRAPRRLHRDHRCAAAACQSAAKHRRHRAALCGHLLAGCRTRLRARRRRQAGRAGSTGRGVPSAVDRVRPHPVCHARRQAAAGRADRGAPQAAGCRTGGSTQRPRGKLPEADRPPRAPLFAGDVDADPSHRSTLQIFAR